MLGKEWPAAVVACLSGVIATVAAHGGDVHSVGSARGDAIIAVWWLSDSDDAAAEGVARCAACALAIAALPPAAVDGGAAKAAKIAARVGFARGDVQLSASPSDAAADADTVAWTLAGGEAILANLVAVLRDAKAGEVMTTDDTLQALSAVAKPTSEPTSNGKVKLTALATPPAPAADERRGTLAVADAATTRFLPRIAAVCTAGTGASVAVMTSSLHVTGGGTGLPPLCEMLAALREVAETQGGAVARPYELDACTRFETPGTCVATATATVVFGLPRDDDTAKPTAPAVVAALRAALALSRKARCVDGVSLSAVGVATGTVRLALAGTTAAASGAHRLTVCVGNGVHAAADLAELGVRLGMAGPMCSKDAQKALSLVAADDDAFGDLLSQLVRLPPMRNNDKTIDMKVLACVWNHALLIWEVSLESNKQASSPPPGTQIARARTKAFALMDDDDADDSDVDIGSGGDDGDWDMGSTVSSATTTQSEGCVQVARSLLSTPNRAPHASPRSCVGDI